MLPNSSLCFELFFAFLAACGLVLVLLFRVSFVCVAACGVQVMPFPVSRPYPMHAYGNFRFRFLSFLTVLMPRYLLFA